MEDRIERLEDLVALQDRTIEELNDRIFDQQQQIRDLEKLVMRIASKVKALGENMDQPGTVDVPPPHYNG